jgi:ABC-type Mn2+/Zn2+ transport system permease subunit
VKRLPQIIGLGMVFAVVSTVAGFYASYYADVASGSAVVLTLTVIFLTAFVVSSIRRRAARDR